MPYIAVNHREGTPGEAAASNGVRLKPLELE